MRGVLVFFLLCIFFFMKPFKFDSLHLFTALLPTRGGVKDLLPLPTPLSLARAEVSLESGAQHVPFFTWTFFGLSLRVCVSLSVLPVVGRFIFCYFCVYAFPIFSSAPPPLQHVRCGRTAVAFYFPF